jgi:predicted flap endonuclease-1-like 5' DNA nuclease
MMRRIGSLVWDRENHHTVDVPGELAGEVLSQPGEPFEIAADDPLRALVGIDEAGLIELALAGIGSLDDLAQASKDEITNINQQKLAAWIKQAHQLCKSTKQSEED